MFLFSVKARQKTMPCSRCNKMTVIFTHRSMQILKNMYLVDGSHLVTDSSKRSINSMTAMLQRRLWNHCKILVIRTPLSIITNTCQWEKSQHKRSIWTPIQPIFQPSPECSYMAQTRRVLPSILKDNTINSFLAPQSQDTDTPNCFPHTHTKKKWVHLVERHARLHLSKKCKASNSTNTQEGRTDGLVSSSRQGVHWSRFQRVSYHLQYLTTALFI